MGDTLFSLGEVSCDLCWCFCNVDHREEAKEKVSDWLRLSHNDNFSIACLYVHCSIPLSTSYLQME
jgi:hypothetical protein